MDAIDQASSKISQIKLVAMPSRDWPTAQESFEPPALSGGADTHNPGGKLLVEPRDGAGAGRKLAALTSIKSTPMLQLNAVPVLMVSGARYVVHGKTGDVGERDQASGKLDGAAILALSPGSGKLSADLSQLALGQRHPRKPPLPAAASGMPSAAAPASGAVLLPPLSEAGLGSLPQPPPQPPALIDAIEEKLLKTKTGQARGRLDAIPSVDPAALQALELADRAASRSFTMPILPPLRSLPPLPPLPPLPRPTDGSLVLVAPPVVPPALVAPVALAAAAAAAAMTAVAAAVPQEAVAEVEEGRPTNGVVEDVCVPGPDSSAAGVRRSGADSQATLPRRNGPPADSPGADAAATQAQPEAQLGKPAPVPLTDDDGGASAADTAPPADAGSCLPTGPAATAVSLVPPVRISLQSRIGSCPPPTDRPTGHGRLAQIERGGLVALVGGSPRAGQVGRKSHGAVHFSRSDTKDLEVYDVRPDGGGGAGRRRRRRSIGAAIRALASADLKSGCPRAVDDDEEDEEEDDDDEGGGDGGRGGPHGREGLTRGLKTMLKSSWNYVKGGGGGGGGGNGPRKSARGDGTTPSISNANSAPLMSGPYMSIGEVLRTGILPPLQTSTATAVAGPAAGPITASAPVDFPAATSTQSSSPTPFAAAYWPGDACGGSDGEGGLEGGSNEYDGSESATPPCDRGFNLRVKDSSVCTRRRLGIDGDPRPIDSESETDGEVGDRDQGSTQAAEPS